WLCRCSLKCAVPSQLLFNLVECVRQHGDGAGQLGHTNGDGLNGDHESGELRGADDSGGTLDNLDGLRGSLHNLDGLRSGFNNGDGLRHDHRGRNADGSVDHVADSVDVQDDLHKRVAGGNILGFINNLDGHDRYRLDDSGSNGDGLGVN
ncbi:hypothetical protein P5E51_15650, partial [Clostridium perfringens]|nr:hypothetical protein [Clostridium perfringens]